MQNTTCAAVGPLIQLPTKQGDLFDPNAETNYNKFLQFHQEFPKVYTLFEKFSLELIYKGHTLLGAKMIIERIRWELATGGSKDEHGFKINNNFTCYYSRMFAINNPRYAKMFEYRKVKSL